LQVLCPYFVDTDMVSDVSIPVSFFQVASPVSVVRSSLKQMGQARGPGELPFTSGTFMHDLISKVLVTVNNNTPMFFTKIIGYYFYDKPNKAEAKKRD